MWDTLTHFLDAFVELIDSHEAELKDKCENYEIELQSIIEEIEIHTVNKNMASSEIDSNPEATEIYETSHELLKTLEQEKKVLKKHLREIGSGRIREECL